MIDLIVVDSFDQMMFKVEVRDWLAMTLGDKIWAKFDKDKKFIGRMVPWEDFKKVMDSAY